MRAHAVVRQPQVFCRIDVGHARHQNAAGVHAKVFVVSDVDFFIFRLKDSHQRGELFFGGTCKAPVDERIVRVLLKQIPGDQTAGVDEVGFKVGVLGHFFIVKGRWRKHVQIFQATALQ